MKIMNTIIVTSLLFIFFKVFINIIQDRQIKYTNEEYDSSGMDHLMDDENLHEQYMDNEEKYKEKYDHDVILSRLETQFTDKKKYFL